MSEIKVFISYSHDSDEHSKRVLALSERLRKDGIETTIDQYENGSPKKGWARWMMNGLNAASHVVCVCTETYSRRFLGQEVPGKGKGADWEGALITQALYDARGYTNKFIPVLFDRADEEHVPIPLRGQSHYVLDSERSYQAFYDSLLDQSGVEPGAVGELKVKPRATGRPTRFDGDPAAPARAASPPSQAALNIWHEKLEFLLVQDAICVDPAMKFNLKHLIAEAKTKIAELESSTSSHSSNADISFRADITRIVKYAPVELIGREAETKLLSDAWDKAVRGEKPRPHVLTFVALGGEGKTSLVTDWAVKLENKEWPGCEAVFAWSFYSQGTREQTAVSSDLFLRAALTFFGDPAAADSAQGTFDKGQRLAQLVGARRALLILDGVEPLQYAPTSPTPGELKDQGLAVLLKRLAATNLGLCVVTTRYSIPDLRAYRQTTAPETNLLRLSKEAGVALLRSLGVRKESGSNVEFETLVEDVKGHALTLNLLGTYLRDAHGGDIRRRDLVKLEEADAEEQGGHAFRVMDAYAESFTSDGEKGQRALALLSLLGLFDRPAAADCLAALLKKPAIRGLTGLLVVMSEAKRNIAFTRLESAKLLTVNRDAAGLVSLDAHPLLREYFARRVREQQPKAWRAAHRRLYEHLCATTPDKRKPTLEDLQPLYQAVAHGCQAGMQQEACEKVYYARVRRGKEHYAPNKLGAWGPELGAIACFFETPWSRVSPLLREAAQAWLLNEAAFSLRSLGRLTEALEPMRAGMNAYVKLGQLRQAAISASNLSELKLALGDVAGAVGNAEQSVTYADRSRDASQRIATRTTHAYALHQAGRRAEAEARFREAEEMQAELQSEYKLLYSLRGFQYCDLLLAAPERSAWQRSTGFQPADPPGVSPGGPGGETPPDPAAGTAALLQSCRAVSQRAAQTLQWVQKNNDLLSIALNHLSLGRAALYSAILEKSELRKASRSSAETAGGRSDIDQAMHGLRRAGSQDYVPLGLLTRAWLRSLTGARRGSESAQSDLDDAWEIAERGPMPLFMADIHLHRARLFGRKTELKTQLYPWESPQHDLAEARRLIEKHGYWRRKEELEDAEKANLL